uniref:Beta-microseminoprotein n=1 Tax=Monodelphis domestica TaxID=13616 RepID=K7E120_MONDO
RTASGVLRTSWEEGKRLLEAGAWSWRSLQTAFLQIGHNAIIGVFLTWNIIVTSCNTQCKITPLEIFKQITSKGCKDPHGLKHALHSQWQSDRCENCACTEKGMVCCSIIMRPIGYNTASCKLIFDKKHCVYVAVMKNNPSQTCKFSSYTT